MVPQWSVTDLLNRIIGKCQLNNEDTHTNARTTERVSLPPSIYPYPPADKNTEK